MKNIQGMKIGNKVNISIDGKLYDKNCGSPKEADELFKIVLKAKADPTPENLKAIRLYLNEKLRVAMFAGLESDLETGEVFLAGFNTPIPDTLVQVIKDYSENNYPLEAVKNFWKLLMINPDKRVRTSLFDFIKTHDFVLTDSGYMVVYKAVDVVKKKDNDLLDFITNQYLFVRKQWKCSPNKYVVLKDKELENLSITKAETAAKWDLESDEHQVEILGNLGDMFRNIDNLIDADSTEYTDMHTHKMSIKLGVPTKQTRKECDSDPRKDCSNGLHCGATAYVENFGRGGKAILVCLVNPMNVVAVPDYDHSKMRVCEYFPVALADYVDEKIDIIEQTYFENDYQTFEEKALEEMIAKVKAEELPIEKAKNMPEAEVRPMAELMKILETRLLDLE